MQTQEIERDVFSIVNPVGYQMSSCGYCADSTKKGRTSVGFLSSKFQPDHYQLLVDRGWRRSGKYYYKPDNRNTCCPNYTIRLDASEFKARKDQKRALHRWNRHVLGRDFTEKLARHCPLSKENKKQQRNSFSLYDAVHKAESSHLWRRCEPQTREDMKPEHQFVVNLEPDSFTIEKYQLYANYQKCVHKEDDSEISQNGFRRFLCSGLGQFHFDRNGRKVLLGSFHQCYRLDGRLVALGVLDLLPHAVSSVYLIYHEDFQDWNFGKMSALREITLAIEEGYKYYYMGYYIHSCVKMRYKGAFRPTQLLDPVTNTWTMLDDDLKARFSARRFVSMTIERRLGLPRPDSEANQASHLTSQPTSRQTASIFVLGNVKYDDIQSYVRGDEPRPVDRDQAASVFRAGTPGVMSLDEVQRKIDCLKNWNLIVGINLYCLQDLTLWETDEIEDPTSLKGAAAELAASMGLDLVEQTVLGPGA